MKKTLMMFNMSNSLKLFSFKFFVSFFISHLSFLVLVFTHKNTFRMFICNRNIFLFVYQLIYVSKISVDICNSFQFLFCFFYEKNILSILFSEISLGKEAGPCQMCQPYFVIYFCYIL